MREAEINLPNLPAGPEESTHVSESLWKLGRQPWLIYNLFHTRDGYSKVVSSGDTIFTLIGFTGLYFVLGLLFLGLTGRELAHGPDNEIASGGKELVE